MSVTDRIAEMRARSQVQEQNIASLNAASQQELETKKSKNLASFDKFVEKTGLRKYFDEVTEGQHIEGAGIHAIVSSDGDSASLVLSWLGQRGEFRQGHGVMTYPDIGENSIKVGIDYKNNYFFIEGARRKFSTDPR